MKRLRTVLGILGALVVAIAATFGVRYFNGTWAPSQFKGGIRFPERPSITTVSGDPLSEAAIDEFLGICAALRSTTRDIGENRGSGHISCEMAQTGESEILTIYPKHNVVFVGWWIDAKTHAMMGRRAPCFELSDDFKTFIERHRLESKTAEEEADAG